MDGNYGSLVFIATQSDVLQRSEIIRSLSLPANASKLSGAASKQHHKSMISPKLLIGHQRETPSLLAATGGIWKLIIGLTMM